MSNSTTKLSLFVFALSVALGAVAATLFMHIAIYSHTGNIDLGDSIHGYLKLHSQRNVLAESNSNPESYMIQNNQVMPGKLVEAAGNIK